jgi:2-dehydro-3-deoxygluconokinase
MNQHKHGVSAENKAFCIEQLGIYFLETGAVARPSKIIYDRSHTSISEIKPGMSNWEKVIEIPNGFIGPVILPPSRKALLTPLKKPFMLLIALALRFLRI